MHFIFSYIAPKLFHQARNVSLQKSSKLTLIYDITFTNMLHFCRAHHANSPPFSNLFDKIYIFSFPFKQKKYPCSGIHIFSSLSFFLGESFCKRNSVSSNIHLSNVLLRFFTFDCSLLSPISLYRTKPFTGEKYPAKKKKLFFSNRYGDER